MALTQLPPELTHEQIASFHDRGFLLLGRFVSDEDLGLLRNVYDQVLERRMGHVHREASDRDGPDARYQIQVLQPEYTFPELLETEYFRYGRHIASKLLATPEADLRGYSHLIYKPPLHARDTTWHQDEAYWLNAALRDNEPRAVTIWLTLDEASLESGCMSFLPGSHDRVVPHGFEGNSASLVVTHPDLSRVEVCPMSAGEASVHTAARCTRRARTRRTSDGEHGRSSITLPRYHGESLTTECGWSSSSGGWRRERRWGSSEPRLSLDPPMSDSCEGRVSAESASRLGTIVVFDATFEPGSGGTSGDVSIACDRAS